MARYWGCAGDITGQEDVVEDLSIHHRGSARDITSQEGVVENIYTHHWVSTADITGQEGVVFFSTINTVSSVEQFS